MDLLGLKNIFIASVIGIITGLIIGGYSAYSLTSSKYEASITAERLTAAQHLAEINASRVSAERKLNNATTEFNKLTLEKDKRTSALFSANRELLNERNRLLIKPDSGDASTRASDGASCDPSNSASTVELPRAFSEFLSQAFLEADRAADYAAIAHEYAIKIKEQRERMIEQDE